MVYLYFYKKYSKKYNMMKSCNCFAKTLGSAEHILRVTVLQHVVRTDKQETIEGFWVLKSNSEKN